jgi:hypothetical protein
VEQIKRRRAPVAEARAEVARRRLAKTADYTPAYSEQKELLRMAEASLQDAELRSSLVRKWEPLLNQAILEYHATTRRLSNLASGDVPRAMAVLERMVTALEAYLNVAVPSGGSSRSSLESIVEPVLGDAFNPPPESEESEPTVDEPAHDDDAPAALEAEPGPESHDPPA